MQRRRRSYRHGGILQYLFLKPCLLYRNFVDSRRQVERHEMPVFIRLQGCGQLRLLVGDDYRRAGHSCTR